MREPAFIVVLRVERDKGLATLDFDLGKAFWMVGMTDDLAVIAARFVTAQTLLSTGALADRSPPMGPVEERGCSPELAVVRPFPTSPGSCERITSCLAPRFAGLAPAILGIARGAHPRRARASDVGERLPHRRCRGYASKAL